MDCAHNGCHGHYTKDLELMRSLYEKVRPCCTMKIVNHKDKGIPKRMQGENSMICLGSGRDAD